MLQANRGHTMDLVLRAAETATWSRADLVLIDADELQPEAIEAFGRRREGSEGAAQRGTGKGVT